MMVKKALVQLPNSQVMVDNHAPLKRWLQGVGDLTWCPFSEF